MGTEIENGGMRRSIEGVLVGGHVCRRVLNYPQRGVLFTHRPIRFALKGRPSSDWQPGCERRHVACTTWRKL